MADDLLGLDALRARLRAYRLAYPAEVGRAQRQVTEYKATICKAACPIEFGVLRGTIHAEGPELRSDGAILTAIVAGGPSASYALIVHENLTARHAEGTGAKYIERPLMEAASTIIAEIAEQVDLNRMPT